MADGQRNRIFLQIGQLLRDLQLRPPEDRDTVLREITGSAALLVPGAQAAWITTATRDGKVETVSASSSQAAAVDDIQRRASDGPCLAAAWAHRVMRLDDMATEVRWPRFCAEVMTDTSVRSILAFELFADRHQMGALNFLSEQPRAFDDEDSVEVGLIMATHAALAWTMLARDKQFRSALASRDVIGQAKGMIMERFDIDAVAAFDLLRRLSQNANKTLNAVSEELVRPRSEQP